MSWRKKRLIAVLAAMFVAGIIAVVVWPGEREPEYQGRKLSEWMHVYETNAHAASLPVGILSPEESSQAAKRRDQAAGAIRAIGTNGVPFLVNLATPAVSKSEHGLYVYAAVHGWYSNTFARSVIWRDDKALLGKHGLMVLGEQADCAVPELDRRLRDGVSDSAKMYAIFALTCAGPRGIQHVVDIITNRTAPSQLRGAGIISLGFRGPACGCVPTNAAMPAVMFALADEDAGIRSVAELVFSDLSPRSRTHPAGGSTAKEP